MSDPPPPAFYALRAGGWRDIWNLLHPPYTLWHLSYVAIGASLADEISIPWLLESLLAFALAMGVAAHALDELQGRPLGTRIPRRTLWLLAGLGLAAAVALGLHGAVAISPWFVVFVAVGVFLVIAYNLESFGGRFHTDVWFALAWGGFPAVTGYFAQTGRVEAAAVVVAAGCAVLSFAQRRLSTPAREIRRRVASVDGEMRYTDGTRRDIDARTLTAAPEGALRALSLALPLLALGLVLAAVL